VYDFKNTRLSHKKVPLGLGKYVRMAQYKKDIVRVVITATKGYNPVAYQPMLSGKEYHISLPKGRISKPIHKISKHKSNKKAKAYNPHKHELIVIDAGHGGHDTGAIGGGKREKDLVLQIAKRLERQLKKRGHPVYMTRKRDRFLKLRQRTKIADKKKAVLFLSIHANSVAKSKRNRIHGIETFFLQNTRDAKSQRIAARENKSVLKGTTKLSRNVIIDSVLTGPKIVESNKLAIDVQRRMITNLRTKYSGVKDSGVRHAPFWVLVGASRPSILVEVGYISHPRERKRLFSSKYQELLVKGIAEGVDSYLRNRQKEIDFLE
jgi:N-acetylmuramoyl-L-alanine amidase